MDVAVDLLNLVVNAADDGPFVVIETAIFGGQFGGDCLGLFQLGPACLIQRLE